LKFEFEADRELGARARLPPHRISASRSAEFEIFNSIFTKVRSTPDSS
jgi:hypothetical protein